MHVPDAREKEIAARYFSPFIGRFSECKAVLDVASGRGFLLKLFKHAGITAKGIELDEELCRQCRERGLDVEQASFFDYLKNCPCESADGAVASHIIEHFAPKDVEELFRLLAPVLKPGAPFLIMTPNPRNLRRMVGDFWRDPTHVRPYPGSAIGKLLKSAGGWEGVESAEYSDRRPSLRRKIIYAIRNALLGSYLVGDDVYVIARRVKD
ncbi:MAG: hypothetical protein CMO80_23385 [Verrucomicrobiales bacterium]|nr:hypothetical protein [Verrucomicrobiales bacterium]